MDWLFAFVPTAVFLTVGIVIALGDGSTGLAVLLIIAGSLWWLILGFWNKVFREGRTGQSIGKSKSSISLVDATTGQPLGAGRAFLRELIAYLLASVTGGIYWIIDYLFPLWDSRKQRLTDKIISSVVVRN